jgi:type II secretory pathway component PulJ
MNPIQRALTRLRRDEGITLAELAVTTSIMSAVMAIFTTGVVQLFQAGNNNELVAMTESQLNTAFLRLDRNLRYASGIGPIHPGTGGSAVEYVNTDTADGQPECAQLELNTANKVLRRQVWPQTTKPTGKWAVLASGLDIAQSSFTLPTPLADTGFQRLKVTLVVASNPGRGHAESKSVITFTALNSTRATDASKVCPEARP